MIASLCITWLGALATGPGAHGAVPEDRAASNVLLIVLDDVGADAISCYPGAAADARTPVIDRLAAEGVRFDRVWANPACSPTRATILTGRYGFRTGVGSVKVREEGGLAPEEVTLAESLRAADPSVRTAFLGKWHLGPGEEQGPVPQGFERFRGTTGNLGGREGAYFEYPERAGRDLATVTRRRYATSAVVDDALAVIDEFGPAPWLVVASFHAAHNPLHAPPAELHDRDLSEGPAPGDRARFMAMVDALDREIGRLVDGLDPEVRRRTHVIVLSDNGGASRTRLPGHPGRQGKGSLFEDGVRVPMVVAGPAVARPGRASDTLVNTTDLFATIHELLGARPAAAAQDSVSFAPVLRGASTGGRRWCLAERFQDGRAGRWPRVDRYTLTDGRFKRTVDVEGGSARLHDLSADPLERVDLLKLPELPEAAAAADEALRRVVARDLRRAEAMEARRRAAEGPAQDGATGGVGSPDEAKEPARAEDPDRTADPNRTASPDHSGPPGGRSL